MKMVMFVGLQASGKSTFYKRRFFHSHLRINLDQIRTRNRETRLLDVCFDTHLPFVVDNTNPCRQERSHYIRRAKQNRMKVIGYYFRSCVQDCLIRNARRAIQVPEIAIRATAKRIEIPNLNEGFDELWYVRFDGKEPVVEEWNNEL